MNLDKWTADNNEHINTWLTHNDYKSLLNAYYQATNMSLARFAVHLKCSRRAMGRYLTGERMVPMEIIRRILNALNLVYIDHEEISEFDELGKFIWYGDKEILFNVLYLFRVKVLKLSRFQAACNLNIPCEILKSYENGKKRIPFSDLHKITDVYNLEIENIYPSLVSYDGRRTFLPLLPVCDVILQNDIIEHLDDTYSSVNYDTLIIWPNFPIQRYDANGTPLLKYMPNELSVDEYINTDELCFIKDDMESFYEFDFSNKKLPPSYKHILEFFMTDNPVMKDVNYSHFSICVSDIILLEDYNVKLCVGHGNIFSLKEYVFSDSPWYSMLRNIEYFYKGRLTYVGEKIPTNQCIVWPDGQYVRIIELYKDKYPYRYYEEAAGIGVNGRYSSWILYKLPYAKSCN